MYANSLKKHFFMKFIILEWTLSVICCTIVMLTFTRSVCSLVCLPKWPSLIAWTRTRQQYFRTFYCIVGFPWYESSTCLRFQNSLLNYITLNNQTWRVLYMRFINFTTSWFYILWFLKPQKNLSSAIKRTCYSDDVRLF